MFAFFLILLASLLITLILSIGVHATIQPVDEKGKTISQVDSTFSGEEQPSFLIRTDGLVREKQKKSAQGELRAEKGQLVASVYSVNGVKFNYRPTIQSLEGQDDAFLVTLPATQEFTPGKYSITIELANETTTQTLKQDFTWGVLAINFSQSSYRVEEAATIGLAVLDDAGHTLCNAKLNLEITDPNKTKTILNTDDQTVKISETCVDKNVTNQADYVATFKPSSEGQHILKVTAETLNGTRTRSTSFEVNNNPTVIVKRFDSATRIYPLSEYTVSIEVVSAMPMDTIVHEIVPARFELKNISPAGSVVTKENDKQTIAWPVNLIAGQPFKLSYTYKAPEVSPEFYHLGPMQIIESLIDSEGETAGLVKNEITFTEPRAWEVAADAVESVGRLFYSDTGNQGTIKLQTRSNSDVWSSETDSTITPFAVATMFISAVNAPTRDEMFIASLHKGTSTGDFAVTKCTGGCDASGDFTGDTGDNFTFSGSINASPVCTNSPTNCWRPFDIAYEQLSGEALVVFADAPNTADSGSGVKYCTFDGSSWSGTNCGTPSDLTVTSGTGVIQWVRLIPQGGGQLTKNRTNRILVLMLDSNNDLFGMVWDGSSFTDQKVIDTDISVNTRLVFDGEWETIPTGNNTTENRAVVFFGGTSTAGTSPWEYIVYTAASGWDTSPTAMPAVTESSLGNWVDAAADPKSDRICVAVKSGSAEFNAYVWRARADAADAVTKGNGDTDTEPAISPDVACAWEKTNGAESNASVALFVASDSSTTDISQYETWTSAASSTGTFSSLARIGSANAAAANDDTNAFMDWGVSGAPNGDTIMVVEETITSDLESIYWDGSAWALADYLIDPAGTTAGSDNIPPDCPSVNCMGSGYRYVWYGYKAWQKDWRWSNGNTDTASTPTTFLAAENTTPSAADTTNDLFRLRVQIEELGDVLSETDARKKLQFVPSSTCASPNSCINSNWIDVADPAAGGAAWEYAADADIACTATDCDDGVALTGTALSGTTACGSGGCGTWVGDKDAAAGSSMDHTTAVSQEIEYVIKNVSASATTYYFRVYDVTDGTVIYRQQDLATACGSDDAACTYPSLTLTSGTRIQGTVYLADETTAAATVCDGSTAIVSIRINTGAATTGTCHDTAATYDITTSTAASAGDTITVYLTSSTKANTVYLSDGSDDTSIDLYENTLAIRHENAGPTSILDILDYDSTTNDTDMLFDAVDATPDTLMVEDAVELHVNTGDTFTPGGTITTSPSADGTDTVKDGDLHIDGTGVLTMGTNALSVGGDFNNEGTFNKSTGQTTTFTATATAHTITDGGENFDSVTFNGSSGGWSTADATIIDVDLTVTAGTLSGTSNLTVNGGDATGDGTINLTGGTFTLDAAGNFGGATGWTFSSLTLGDGSGATTTTATGAGSMTITSALTISTAQTLDAKGKTWILSGTGTPLTVSGTLDDTADSSTFRYSGNGATTITASATYHNLQIYPGGASVTHTLAGGTFTLTGNLDLGGNSNGASTVVTAGTNNPTVNVGGNLTLCASTCSNQMTFTKSSNTLTLSPTGTKTWTDNNPTTKQDVGVLSIASGTSTPKISLDSSAKATTVTIAASHTLDLGTSSYILDLGGTGAAATVLTVSGTLTPGTSTVKYSATNSGGTVTVAVTTYNSLVLSGAETYDLGGNLTSGNALTGNVTIDSGATLDTVSGSNYGITLGGSWSNSGTFTARTGTVTFNSTATGKTLSGTMTSGSKFNNLTFDGSGGAWSFGSDAAEVGGNFSVTTGTVTAPSSTLTVSGNFSVDGSFTHNSGTVVLDTTGTAAVTGPATFNNFSSTTAGKTITFETSGSPTFTFAGTFTITGASGNQLHVHSDSAGTKWKAHFNSVQSAVTHAHIHDGGCSTTTSQVTYAATMTDGGNNEWCWFRNLTFSLDATSKDFGTITPGATHSDQTSTVTTTSNARDGYQVTLWATQLLTKGSSTIANWTGSNTTPTTLTGAGTSAFGYSTNDSSLAGGTADRFTSASNLFAGFASSGSGDIVADNTSTASSEAFTITYRLRAGANQDPGTYTTTLIYICTATY